MSEITHEVTLTCQACDMPPIGAPHAEGDDPETSGLLANVSAVHVEANPGHTFTYIRETLAEAAARRAQAAEREREERRALALEVKAQETRRAERVARAQATARRRRQPGQRIVGGFIV